MKWLATSLAVFLTVVTLLSPLPAWCLSGICELPSTQSIPSQHDCCHPNATVNEGVDQPGEADDCQDCLAFSDTDSTIPSRLSHPLPIVALIQQPLEFPVDFAATTVEGMPVLFPTGPPQCSAILRDLRTVCLVI